MSACKYCNDHVMECGCCKGCIEKDAEIGRLKGESATAFLLQQNQELREQRAGLTEEIERLRAEIKMLTDKTMLGDALNEVGYLQKKNAELEAQAAQMREAIQDQLAHQYCEYCMVRTALWEALSPDCGRALAERVRKLEAVAEAARAFADVPQDVELMGDDEAEERLRNAIAALDADVTDAQAKQNNSGGDVT